MKLLQGKGRPRSPANHQKPGESRDPFSVTASEGSNPANTLILDFWPPELGDSLLLKPLSLWYFVTAALAKEYRFVLRDMGSLIQQKNVLS